MRVTAAIGNSFAGADLACLRGGRLVFAALPFRLEGGGALVVTGPNGSGKSSLLRLMAGLIRPFAGSLLWDGADVADDPDAHRRRVGYVGHLDAVKPALPALANIAFWAGLADAGTDAGTAAERACAALDAFGLAALADVPGRYLSAGQRRRLALARLVAMPRTLWLLDEPTVALDRDGIARLEQAIAGHRAGGGLVVAATHAPLTLPGAAALDLAAYALDAPEPWLPNPWPPDP